MQIKLLVDLCLGKFYGLFLPKIKFKEADGLSRWLSGKESACQCKRCKFDPWVRKIPGEGNDNPLQDSPLGNPMDRRTWQAVVHRVTKESDMT